MHVTSPGVLDARQQLGFGGYSWYRRFMLMEQLASTSLDRWSHPTPNPTIRIPVFLRGQLMAESECSVTSFITPFTSGRV